MHAFERLAGVEMPPGPQAASNTARPHLSTGSTRSRDPPDQDAGPWNSKPAETSYQALKGAIYNAQVVVGDDAAAHLRRHFAGTGKVYKVDLEDMIEDVPSARQSLESELDQAMNFAESVPVGQHHTTSRKAEGGYNDQSENANWHFAIGGYASWGKGKGIVEESASQRSYEMDFEYKMYDRCNLDNGKTVNLVGIETTDKFMGEFHRQGLAREFDCRGSLRRSVTWKHGEAATPNQLDTKGGR